MSLPLLHSPPIISPKISQALKSLVSRSSSGSSVDMDEEGGASIEEIMGFGNFNGTKREPKHNGKVGGGKAGTPMVTGANSQPVAVRQLPFTSNQTHPLPNKPSQMVPTANPFIPASIAPISQPQSVRPDENRAPQDTITPNFGQDAPASALHEAGIIIPSSLIGAPLQTLETNVTPTLETNGTFHNSQAGSKRSREPNDVGYKNPTSGFSLTNAELSEYARGKVEKAVNANGEEYEVKVYFQPSFVEDPWAKLR